MGVPVVSTIRPALSPVRRYSFPAWAERGGDQARAKPSVEPCAIIVWTGLFIVGVIIVPGVSKAMRCGVMLWM